ncbi:hypothetical protein Hanom_Chr12g01093571 [Helianthus anomalus]
MLFSLVSVSRKSTAKTSGFSSLASRKPILFLSIWTVKMSVYVIFVSTCYL